MEIKRSILSCVLLGTFHLLSYPSLSISQSIHKRLLVATAPANTIQQYLVPHNIERSKLGLPPLKGSNKLVKFASWWAQQRQGDCQLRHSNSNYGENLFWGSGSNWKPSDAVKAWAAEKSYYNYNENACVDNKDCLHYTQMIWKQSLKVGCAKVVCRSGDTFATCNYDPHGNVIGQKPF